MKPLILIVEDEKDTLFQLKEFLELNDYEVSTAINGKDGLETLLNLKSTPDLIISDIIMPEMNGYDFYMKVSEKLSWSKIPFFFLTGKAETDDVRFGKMLGVDDYITKPYSLKDVLVKIEKKITENKNNILTSNMIEGNLIKIWKSNATTSIEDLDKIKFLYIFYMIWENEKDPLLVDYYPKNEIPSLNLKEIITQLYASLVKIYDYKEIVKSEKYVFRLTINLIDVYILIEKNNEMNPNDGNGTHMLSAISPNFHYFQSERIKGILSDIATMIRNDKKWDIREYWEKMLVIYQDIN